MGTPETPVDELSTDAANATYQQVMPDEGGAPPIDGRSALQHLGLPGSGGDAGVPDGQIIEEGAKPKAAAKKGGKAKEDDAGS